MRENWCDPVRAMIQWVLCVCTIIMINTVCIPHTHAQLREWPEDVMDDIIFLREILTVFNDRIDIEDPRILAKRYPNRSFSDFDRNRDRRFDALDVDLAIIQFLHDPYDLDGDGILGFFELECAFARSGLRLDPANPQTIGGKRDGNLDCDGDRYTNLEEVEAESNLLDPNDMPECRVDANCGAQELCERGRCVPAESCEDGIQNQDESDTDCGGEICGPCGEGYKCNANADCENNECIDGMCQIYACPEDLVNLDQIPQNGCEYFCPEDGRGPEERCDLQDNDCDGVFDEGFDFESDVNRCGGCFGECPEVANGVRGCAGGVCEISACENDWYDIDGEPGDGCEYFCPEDGRGPEERCDLQDNDCDGVFDEGFDFESDVNRCGGCFGECPEVTNAVRGCAEGICGISACENNWHNIDGDLENGCEYFCEPDPRGPEEYCENRDNDCDGLFDEAPACNLETGEYQTCVISEDRTEASCWGNLVFIPEGAALYSDDPGEMGDNIFRLRVGPDRKILKVSIMLHTLCALLDDHQIYCQGNNSRKQAPFGDSQAHYFERGTPLEETFRVDLGDDNVIVDFQLGYGNSCALFQDGRIKCWGYFTDEEGRERYMGTQPEDMGNNLPYVDLGGRVLSIASENSAPSSSGYHACALLEGGEVKCWGRGNGQGQLGQGDTEPRFLPDQLGENLLPVDLGPMPAVAVEVGQINSCAILQNGELKCWGRFPPQFRDGEPPYYPGDDPGEMGENLWPVYLGEGAVVKQIELVHNIRSCALLESGQVRCWGPVRGGVVGYLDPEAVDEVGHSIGDEPGEMEAFVQPLDFGVDEQVTAISMKFLHVCAIFESSRVKCWGWNSAASLGHHFLSRGEYVGDDLNELAELPFVLLEGCNENIDCPSQVCDCPEEGCEQGGGPFECAEARCDDGVRNQNEGDIDCGVECGPCANRQECIVADDCASGTCDEGRCVEAHCTNDETDGDESDLNCGGGCMPCADQAACADGSDCASEECVEGACQISECPVNEHNLDGLPQNGCEYFCEPDPRGPEEYCDGRDNDCDGRFDEALGCGLRTGYENTCVVLNEGEEARCWGALRFLRGSPHYSDDPGEMGDNMFRLQVGEGLKILKVSASVWYLCALLDDHQIYCQGRSMHDRGGFGGSGDYYFEPGTPLEQTHRIDLGDDNVIVDFDMGPEYSCALFQDGFVKCWGDGLLNEVGEIEGRVGESPESMGEGLLYLNLGGRAISVSVDYYLHNAINRHHACALLEGGSVKCWGNNEYGQLGQGNVESVFSHAHLDEVPTIDLGQEPVVAVRAGRDIACAILQSGKVKCWGYTLQRAEAEGNPFIGDAPNEMGESLTAWFLGDQAVARQIETADRRFCALLSDGEVRCWGNMSQGIVGYYDQEVRDEARGYLGDDYVGGDSVEMEEFLEPIAFGVEESVKSISFKFLHACATFESGQVKCWGRNVVSSLGHHFLGHADSVESELGELAALPFVLLEGCNENIDCPSLVCDCPEGDCEAGGGPFECLEATCEDGVQNQNEVDVDCGGPCGLCADGQFCDFNEDCGSGVCQQNRCAFAHCLDGVWNEDETHADCGGMDCLPCGVGLACVENGDCDSDVCALGECRVSSCGDEVLGENETDVDCGGLDCGPCEVEAACNNGLDCDSRVCSENICAAPTCDDGEMNQDESDEDCGGATCDACEAGLGCSENADCFTGICQSFMCRDVSCDNGQLDEGEEDIDCGGPCGECPFEFEDIVLGIAVCEGEDCPSVCGQEVPEGLECDEACQEECVVALVGEEAAEIEEEAIDISLAQNALSSQILLSAKKVDIDENTPIAFDPGLRSDSERVVSPVQFGPSGQTFLEPLVIRVALTEPLEPSTIHPLLEFDEDAGMWKQARFARTGGPSFAIVDETGQNAIYAIDHFSIFAVEFDERLYSTIDVDDVRYHFPGGIRAFGPLNIAARQAIRLKSARKIGYYFIFKNAAYRRDKESNVIMDQINSLIDEYLRVYGTLNAVSQTMEVLFHVMAVNMEILEQTEQLVPAGGAQSNLLPTLRGLRETFRRIRDIPVLRTIEGPLSMASCFFKTYIAQLVSTTIAKSRLLSLRIELIGSPLWGDPAVRETMDQLLIEIDQAPEDFSAYFARLESGEQLPGDVVEQLWCLADGAIESVAGFLTGSAYLALRAASFDPEILVLKSFLMMKGLVVDFGDFVPFPNNPWSSFKSDFYSSLLQTLYLEGDGARVLGRPVQVLNPQQNNYFDSEIRRQWQSKQMYLFFAEENAKINAELFGSGRAWIRRWLDDGLNDAEVDALLQQGQVRYRADANLLSQYEATIENSWIQICNQQGLLGQELRDLCNEQYVICVDNNCIGRDIGPFCSDGVLYQCALDQQGCLIEQGSANCPSGACDGQNACLDRCEQINCGDCQGCDNGVCGADPEQVGDPCGNNGVCRANGTCDLCANLNCDANCEWCDSSEGVCRDLGNGLACGRWGECEGGRCDWCENHRCGECEYCDGNGNCRNRNNGTNCIGGTCQNGVCEAPVDLCANHNCDPDCEDCDPNTGACIDKNNGTICGDWGACSNGSCNYCANRQCGECEDCEVVNNNARCEPKADGALCNGGTCLNGACLRDRCEGVDCGECGDCNPNTGQCDPINENADCGRNGKCQAGVCDEDEGCYRADGCRPSGSTRCHYRPENDEMSFQTCTEHANFGCEHLSLWGGRVCDTGRCDPNIGCLP